MEPPRSSLGGLSNRKSELAVSWGEANGYPQHSLLRKKAERKKTSLTVVSTDQTPKKRKVRG